MAASILVAALTAAPVKGLRLAERSQLELAPHGAKGDRVLYLVDENGRMVNGKRRGDLQAVTAELEDGEGRLTLRFPDGSSVAGAIEPGKEIETGFFSRTRPARVLGGPFSAALSQHAGDRLRLVSPSDGAPAVDRGREGAVSVISRGSLSSLAALAGEGRLDARRFRMSIELDGVEPFAEDSWIARKVRVGEALLVANGHVGRCIVTTLHPETGEVDLPTLDRLRDLRGDAPTSEPLAFGIYGAVLEPGMVRVGDPVELA